MNGQRFYENLVYYLRSIAVIGMILAVLVVLYLLYIAPKGIFLVFAEVSTIIWGWRYTLLHSGKEKSKLLAQENQVKLLETFWEFLKEYEIVREINEKEKEMIFSNFISRHLTKNES